MATNADDFLPGDGGFSEDGMSLALNGVKAVLPTDTPGGHAFTVSGWTATLTGRNATGDTMLAGNAGDVTPTSPGQSDSGDPLPLSGVKAAVLTDASGGKTSAVGGGSGPGTLPDTGASGDTVLATRAGNLTPSNFGPSAPGDGLVSTGVEGALATDTAGGDAVTVTGKDSLADTGATGATVLASKAGDVTPTNTSFTNGGDGMGQAGVVANLTDTAADGCNVRAGSGRGSLLETGNGDGLGLFHSNVTAAGLTDTGGFSGNGTPSDTGAPATLAGAAARTDPRGSEQRAKPGASPAARPGLRRSQPRALPTPRLTLEALEARVLPSVTLPQPLPDIALTYATTPDAATISVNYQINDAVLQQPLTFSVYRSSSAPTVLNPHGTDPVLAGTAAVGGANLSLGAHNAVQLTLTDPSGKTVQELPPDPTHSYVVVVANPSGAIKEGGLGAANDFAYFRKHLLAAYAPGYHIAPNDPLSSQLITQGMVSANGYEAYIDLNWTAASVTPAPDLGVAAGDALAAMVELKADSLATHPGDVVDVQFLGHSRGPVVISQALQDLNVTPDPVLRGGYMTMTLIDPQPGNNNTVQASVEPNNPLATAYADLTYAIQAGIQDPQVVVPGNVKKLELLYQHNPWSDFPSPDAWFTTQTELKAAGAPLADLPPETLQGLANRWGETPNEYVYTNGLPLHIYTQNLTGIKGADPYDYGYVGHEQVVYYYYYNVVQPGQALTYFSGQPGAKDYGTAGGPTDLTADFGTRAQQGGVGTNGPTSVAQAVTQGLQAFAQSVQQDPGFVTAFFQYYGTGLMQSFLSMLPDLSLPAGLTPATAVAALAPKAATSAATAGAVFAALTPTATSPTAAAAAAPAPLAAPRTAVPSFATAALSLAPARKAGKAVDPTSAGSDLLQE